MASIAKPVLLAVIGILAVVLFLQTSNLITGYGVSGTNETPGELYGNVTLSNTGPTVYNAAFSTFTNAPTACAQDASNVVCTADVHDEDGRANISSVSGKIYASGSGVVSGCTPDEHSCMSNATCEETTQINLTDATYTCTFDPLYFFAQNGTWTCNVTASDSVATDSDTTTDTRSQLNAIEVNRSSLDWGTMSVGDSKEIAADTVNCGNIEQDLKMNGTDMTCTLGSAIGSKNITYGLTTGSNTLGLNTSYQELEADTTVTTSSSSNTSQVTYWNLTVPQGAAGVCAGDIYFVAVRDESAS